ncbi:Guanine nucleotide-binding protein negative regulator 1 [Cyphellophora attinorum]|uniref:Guanine nucleotide-binding protein negative regulator 1 n=1 Tax=Cyphellophora attinorum TaxID=1664694 RepID=A0A0N1HRM2_9EURO|nr:Guanine nucleotide-binding protein negative regulator 1 [Phialophora attinorum]KPI38487.1 Guanine nucleotide-binding protein negative regulator 1 [Phialophora attinorum]
MDKSFEAKCLAQLPITASIQESDSTRASLNDEYRSLQWTADGTCLLAADYNNNIKTIVVPVDLLESRDDPLVLEIYSSLSSPEPVRALAGAPFFDLQSPSTALILSSVRDHPLHLSSALNGERIAVYPLINPMTEEYICPNSLTFSLDGTHIIAGSESRLSTFDISRPGSGPLHYTQTGPKNIKDDRWNPSTRLRGIISALDIESASNVLAAGTFSRSVGLYEAGGSGTCVGAFSVDGNAADAEIGGSGITQVKWSKCGRYLHIAERNSDGILIYDIRSTGQLLSWCTGRSAVTNQRLSFDLGSTVDEGYHISAGGVDGLVRTWKDAHKQEGAIAPIESMRSHTGKSDAVSGTAAHHAGGVLATASGRDYFKQHESDTAARDARIKIWLVDH